MKKFLFVLSIILISLQITLAGNDTKENSKKLINNVVIKGSVTELINGEKVALPFSYVFIEGTTEVTVSDIEGGFKLKPGRNKKYKIKCTYKGYKPCMKEVECDGSKNHTIDIIMEKE